MKISFLDAAQSEFDDAMDHYEGRRSGLGFEFAEEVEQRWNGSITILKPGPHYHRECAVVS